MRNVLGKAFTVIVLCNFFVSCGSDFKNPIGSTNPDGGTVLIQSETTHQNQQGEGDVLCMAGRLQIKFYQDAMDVFKDYYNSNIDAQLIVTSNGDPILVTTVGVEHTPTASLLFTRDVDSDEDIVLIDYKSTNELIYDEGSISEIEVIFKKANGDLIAELESDVLIEQGNTGFNSDTCDLMNYSYLNASVRHPFEID